MPGPRPDTGLQTPDEGSSYNIMALSQERSRRRAGWLPCREILHFHVSCPSFWQLGIGCAPDPGPAQGPSGSPSHLSKGRLCLPTTGRIFNKPKKPLGRLPTRVPPVSILMTASPGRSKLVHRLAHPSLWPENCGPAGMRSRSRPEPFQAQCRRQRSCLGAASS